MYKLTGLELTFLESWLDGEYGAIEGLTYGAYGELLAYETGVVGTEQLTVMIAAGLSLLLAFSGAGVAWKLYNVRSRSSTATDSAAWATSSRPTTTRTSTRSGSPKA